MKHSFENLAGSKLPKLIGEFLGISPRKISIIYTGTKHSSDFVLKAGDYRFLVGLQRSGLKASLLLTSSGLKKGVMKLKEAVISAKNPVFPGSISPAMQIFKVKDWLSG